GKRGFGTVITRASKTARIFLIDRFSLGTPVHVQPDLMHVTENAHFRIGKSAAKSAGRVEGNGNRDGRFHDEIAVTFSCEIEHSSLPWKKSTLGRGDDRGESCVAPGLDAFVAQARFVGGGAPRRRAGTILRSACGRLSYTAASARAAFCTRGRRRSDPNVGAGIEKAGIDSQPLSFDDPGVRGNLYVFSADGKNHAARDDNRRVFHDRPGNRNHFCATNGEILRLTALRQSLR